MPRFHFNVYDGVTEIDHKGMDLLDWSEARLEAIRRSGIIFQHSPKTLALGEEWRMEVTDESGLILFRLDFSVYQSSAIGSRHGGATRNDSRVNDLS